jgi:hypothetical protein
MSQETFDIFLILLRLKSYLISLMDDPKIEYEGFDYTIEYLDRKFPEQKEEVIELLISNKITSDAQIAFDEKIHERFRDILKDKESSADLTSILEKFQIQTVHDTLQDKTMNTYRTIKDQKLKEIISILLQIARIWTQRSEIEDDIANYSLLNEEEMMRPFEKKKLGELDENTSISYKTISQLTQIYLEQLIDYFFKFGGDMALMEFVSSLEEFKRIVTRKYYSLIKNSGIDPSKL